MAPVTTTASTDSEDTTTQAESGNNAPTTAAGQTETGNNNNNIDNNNNTNNNNTNNNNVASTTASSGEVDNSPIRNTPMRISISTDFDGFVNKFNSEEEARASACDQTMTHLSLTSATFTNCAISRGSVVVAFVLIQSEMAGNATVTSLRTKVFDKTLTLTVNGETFTVDRESLVVSGKPHKPPPPKKEEDSSTVVIIVVVVVLLIIIVVVVVAFFVVKNKQNEKNKVGGWFLLFLYYLFHLHPDASRTNVQVHPFLHNQHIFFSK